MGIEGKIFNFQTLDGFLMGVISAFGCLMSHRTRTFASTT